MSPPSGALLGRPDPLGSCLHVCGVSKELRTSTCGVNDGTMGAKNEGDEPASSGAFGSAVVSVKLGEVVVADRHVHVAARAWRG